MFKHRIAAIAILLMTALLSSASTQGRPDPAALMSAQLEAMKRVASMDGVWRGPAWTLLPSGEKHAIIQTERVGPFLGGSVKVIEGRGYEGDGSVGFNAFAVISYNPATRAYSMRSYAQGFAGDYVFTPTADGFVWEIPAGPATLRYTATIKGGAWREVGDRIVPGGEAAVRFFEMNLTRVSDTSWPAAGAVAAK